MFICDEALLLGVEYSLSKKIKVGENFENKRKENGYILSNDDTSIFVVFYLPHNGAN